MSKTEEWRVEVVEAGTEEEFDSESKAKARFDELTKERYDREIVKLYRVGSVKYVQD
jgi:hypothetical protein